MCPLGDSLLQAHQAHLPASLPPASSTDCCSSLGRLCWCARLVSTARSSSARPLAPLLMQISLLRSGGLGAHLLGALEKPLWCVLKMVVSVTQNLNRMEKDQERE